MSTCAGTNQDGSPCENSAKEGSDYCHLHQDQATGRSAGAPSRPARRFLRLFGIVVILMFLGVVAVRCGAFG